MAVPARRGRRCFTPIGCCCSCRILLELLIKVPRRGRSARDLSGCSLGVASMAMTFSLKAFFDGIGRTHVHMIASLAMNVVNVVLCLALIFGNGRLTQAWGSEARASPACISTWIGLIMMAVWIFLPRYRVAVSTLRAEAPRRARSSRQILRLSIPSAVATVAVMSGFAMFSMIVSHLDSVVARAGRLEELPRQRTRR